MGKAKDAHEQQAPSSKQEEADASDEDIVFVQQRSKEEVHRCEAPVPPPGQIPDVHAAAASLRNGLPPRQLEWDADRCLGC